jgi:hypothetical protein
VWRGAVRRGWARRSWNGAAGSVAVRCGTARQVKAVTDEVRHGEVRRGQAVCGQARRSRCGKKRKVLVRQGGHWKKEIVMRFTKKMKQDLVDEYLNTTGQNVARVAEMREWLRNQPDHPFYAFVFDKDEHDAANQYYDGRLRLLISGLRVTYEVKSIDTSLYDIKVVEKPLHISPVSNRRQGGGYVSFDADSDEMMADFRNEASAALASFCRRYELAIVKSNIDLEELKQMSRRLAVNAVEEAV